MKEMWKSIKNYEGYYEISNLGQVRSIKRNLILKSAVDTHGYLHVVLYKNNTKKDVRIHRLVAETFIENQNNLAQVNHIDGNKLNNRVDNLEWCTNLENHNHAVKIGLIDKKLTLDDIQYIRKNYIPKDKKFGQRALAKKFGVDHKTISRVI